MTAQTYPLRVEADLDPGLSRWLWLVKWFLAIPHFVVLWFLWIAYGVLTIVAFFAILFTGRYPRGIFEFNVGVLRWHWRVVDYSVGVLATDRYPPFTLADVPDYPAHLDVQYPERLSRGLVLVKWWLLAIPHYIIVGILIGGGSWIAWNTGHTQAGIGSNLIGLLALIAVVILAVTGTYPRQLFDLILGLNRWVLRVAAYAGLMTDEYPPFRLDMGGHEPGGTLAIPPSPDAGPAGGPGQAPGSGGGTPFPAPPSAPPAPPRPGAAFGWTGGRVAALVIGVLMVLVSVAAVVLGGFALWATGQRDAAGYVTLHPHTFSADTYALVVSDIELGGSAPGDVTPTRLLGDVRIRVTPTDSGQAVFVGIARTADVDGYLAGVERSTARDLFDNDLGKLGSGAPTGPPTAQTFWVASSAGPGTRTLRWETGAGTWSVVVMNADASKGVRVRADVGATLPDIGPLGALMLAGGLVFFAGGVGLIMFAVIRASRRE